MNIHLAIKYVKFQRSTYPCNDMLDNILKLLEGDISEDERESILKEIW